MIFLSDQYFQTADNLDEAVGALTCSSSEPSLHFPANRAGNHFFFQL
jgi:hypothetical protein